MYICIYIYTPVYGRWENMRQLFLSFEGRIRTKDTRRPPHASPWWSRIISCRVADPWIGFWVSAYPEIRLLPSLLLHRILLSIIPCLCSYTYLESRRFFDTFILSFPSIVKLFGTLSKKKKEKKLWFSLPSLSKGNFLDFPFAFTHSRLSPRLGYFFLLFLSSSLPFGMAPTRASSCCGWLLIWLSDLCISLIRGSYATTLLHPLPASK